MIQCSPGDVMEGSCSLEMMQMSTKSSDEKAWVWLDSNFFDHADEGIFRPSVRPSRRSIEIRSLYDRIKTLGFRHRVQTTHDNIRGL